LYHKVDGTSGYEVALALATGQAPRIRRRSGPYSVASSFPLRIFQPARVESAPDAATIREVEAAYPGTLIWSECVTGQPLTDFESIEDGQSFRYAIVNVGAADREELMHRFQEIETRLAYRFDSQT
nr:hypothetical protein [Gemmatimonadales bacterium]NIS65319.1 hypothetical protein [Gemmatimonadales bacterium]